MHETDENMKDLFFQLVYIKKNRSCIENSRNKDSNYENECSTNGEYAEKFVFGSDFYSNNTNFNKENTNENQLIFQQSKCPTQEVLMIKCSQLKCGIRPQIVEHSAM